MNVAETIRECTKQHLLQYDTRVASQAISAVGFLANTVPSDMPKHLLDLPTSDASNGGFMVGMALSNKKPIYCVRYQGFLWYNAVSIVNYAAKSKEMWGVPCPILVRCIGMEGKIGPVAGNIHDSMLARMPGLKMFSPMTPNEVKEVFQYFQEHDDVVVTSEHRLSYINSDELENRKVNNPTCLIIGLGAARFECKKAVEQLTDLHYNVNFYNYWKYTPSVDEFSQLKDYVENCNKIVIVHSDYNSLSIAEDLAYTLGEYNKYLIRGSIYSTNVHILGIPFRTAGFSDETDNLTPKAEYIVKFVRENFGEE